MSTQLPGDESPNPYASPTVETTAPPVPPAQRYKGIGGWLILVALQLAYSILRGLATAVNSLSLMLSDTWETLNTPGSVMYHALWPVAIGGDVIGNLGIVLLAITGSVLMFLHSKRFPILMIILYVLRAAVEIFPMIMADVLANTPFTPENAGKLTGQSSFVVLVAVVWIAYMLVSKRVKATFVK